MFWFLQEEGLHRVSEGTLQPNVVVVVVAFVVVVDVNVVTSIYVVVVVVLYNTKNQNNCI